MKRGDYRKAERTAIVNAAESVFAKFEAIKVFGERTVCDDRQYPRESSPTYTYESRLGQIECNVDVSAGMAHFYFRFNDPARAVEAQRKGELPRDWPGDSLNQHSGKWNAWTTPASSRLPLERHTGALSLVADLEQTLRDLNVSEKTGVRTSAHNWNYFNGTQHGWNGPNGYVPPVPMTLAYCADCGPKLIPGFDHSPEKEGHGHWTTGFKCAPWRVGRPCDGCGKDI